VVNTIVTRHTQVHRVDLARYVTRGRLLLHPFHASLRGETLYRAGPHIEQLRQYASLQNAVNIQAVVYSYVDDLRYLAVACFLCAPIVSSFVELRPGRERRLPRTDGKFAPREACRRHS